MSNPQADALADWWRFEIKVRRYLGAGAYGPIFDPPTGQDPDTFQGAVADGTKLVADGTGGQVASAARVACPLTVAYVPVDSEVTLPDSFAAPGQTRVTTVISVSRGDGGGQPTPDHMVLNLL